MRVEREQRRSSTTCWRRVSSLFTPFLLSAFEMSSTAHRSCLPRARIGTGTRAGSEAAEESQGGQERAAGHESQCGCTVSRAPALRFRPACAQRAPGLVAVELQGRGEGRGGGCGRKARWASGRGQGREQSTRNGASASSLVRLLLAPVLRVCDKCASSSRVY